MRVAWIAALALSAAAGAQEGVVATKHNLSATGPGRIKARAETQICIFCHVAHGGEALGMNRPLSQATYRPYASATLRAQPGAPSGATKICLSCHDGTIALGQTIASGASRYTPRPGTAEGPPGGPAQDAPGLVCAAASPGCTRRRPVTRCAWTARSRVRSPRATIRAATIRDREEVPRQAQPLGCYKPVADATGRPTPRRTSGRERA